MPRAPLTFRFLAIVCTVSIKTVRSLNFPSLDAFTSLLATPLISPCTVSSKTFSFRVRDLIFSRAAVDFEMKISLSNDWILLDFCRCLEMSSSLVRYSSRILSERTLSSFLSINLFLNDLSLGISIHFAQIALDEVVNLLQVLLLNVPL